MGIEVSERFRFAPRRFLWSAPDHCLPIRLLVTPSRVCVWRRPFARSAGLSAFRTTLTKVNVPGLPLPRYARLCSKPGVLLTPPPPTVSIPPESESSPATRCSVSNQALSTSLEPPLPFRVGPFRIKATADLRPKDSPFENARWLFAPPSRLPR